MALACDEQGQVPQTAEAEAAVPGRETAPAVVQDVVVFFGADLVRDEGVVGGAFVGLAAGDEVGAGAAHGVLDQVGYEEGEDEGDEPAEDGDVGFVGAGLEDEGPEEEDGEGDGARVDEEPDCGGRVSGGGIRELRRRGIPTDTRSTSACGNCIARLSRENMRWNGSTKRTSCVSQSYISSELVP